MTDVVGAGNIPDRPAPTSGTVYGTAGRASPSRATVVSLLRCEQTNPQADLPVAASGHHACLTNKRAIGLAVFINVCQEWDGAYAAETGDGDATLSG